MPKIQNKYIGKELDWLEEKLASLQKYVDDNPIADMKDRKISLITGKLNKEQVVASIEAQIKSIRDTLKELPELLAAVSNLREKSEKKEIEVRGEGAIPAMMRK